MTTTLVPDIYVLDACAQIAFLQREPGATVVDGLLADVNNVCLAHAVNLCEVYYDTRRGTDTTTAQQAIADLLAAGVQTRDDLDTAFWEQVGELKVSPGRLSLADCFTLALGFAYRGDTGDF